MNGNGKQNEGRNENEREREQNDASAETVLLTSQQSATGQLVYKNCLSFMHYYTTHPMDMKFWEVVEYTPATVSGAKTTFFLLKYRTQGPHNRLGSKMKERERESK